MKDKKKTIIIICIAVIAAIIILASIEVNIYGMFNWNFHYTAIPEEKLLDLGILKNVSYENLGVVELDKSNVFTVFHIDAYDNEPAGVLIAHMKKSGSKYQYLGYYHFFTTETRIDEIIDSESYMEIPRINGIVYNGSIEYLCGYGSVDKEALSKEYRIVSYNVDDSEFNVIYHAEQQ